MKKRVAAPKKDKNRDVKGKVLEFLRKESAFFDEDQYEALLTGTDSISYQSVAARSRTVKEIKDCFEKGSIGRSSIHEAIKSLAKEGNVLVFRYNKKEKKLITDPDLETDSGLGKLIALPTRNEPYSGYTLMRELGGQIIAPTKILRHFIASFSMPDLKKKHFRVHFSWGLRMAHITISDSIWGDLGGRPLVLFLTNSFVAEDKRTQSSIFDVDPKTLGPFGEGIAVLRLPVQGIRPPLKKFKAMGQESWPPLLGTVALTLYPNNKEVLISRFAKEPISVCDLDKSEAGSRSLQQLLTMDRWALAGTRWPEALPPDEEGYQVPVLEDLIPTGAADWTHVDNFLKSKVVGPSHIDCRRWFQFHMNVNGPAVEATSTAPKCDEDSFSNGIVHNSWLIPANSLIGLRQSYFVISS